VPASESPIKDGVFGDYKFDQTESKWVKVSTADDSDSEEDPFGMFFCFCFCFPFKKGGSKIPSRTSSPCRRHQSLFKRMVLTKLLLYRHHPPQPLFRSRQHLPPLQLKLHLQIKLQRLLHPLRLLLLPSVQPRL